MTAMLSVSMLARQNNLSPWRVDEMEERAMDALLPGDALRQAVLSFADRYPALKRDAYALRLLGEELGVALRVVLNPEATAPARYRSDVDG